MSEGASLCALCRKIAGDVVLIPAIVYNANSPGGVAAFGPRITFVIFPEQW
jgi:hypothetical protein